MWIVPAAINSAYKTVIALAMLHGDKMVQYRCRGGCSKSNFDPESYPVVASAVRAAWGAADADR